MRLLFIYFYKEKATFKKNTIIKFSKKYKIEPIQQSNNEHEFNIELKLNDNFQDEFYSSNSDLGVIIGENGTGKSILINSIRDIKNDYSIIVYEQNEKFYFMNHVNKTIVIKLNNKELNVQKRNDNFEYIYYSSILDTSDNDIESKYNISNRNMLVQYDKIPFNNKLSMIENDDIHNYFNMTKETNLDYVKIKKLKIYSSKTYFKEIKEKIIKNYDLEVFEIIINIMDNNVAKYGKEIKSLIKILPNNQQKEVLYFILEDNKNIFNILFNSKSLLDKQYNYIENFLTNKLFKFKDNQYKFLEQDFNLYLRNNKKENKLLHDLNYRLIKYIDINHLSHELDRDHLHESDLYEISYRLTKELYYYFDKDMDSSTIKEYLYDFFRNTTFKYEELIHDIQYNENLTELIIFSIIENLQYELIQEINDKVNYKKEITDNVNNIEKLVKISIINFYIKRFNHIKALENLDARNYPETIYQAIKLNILNIHKLVHNLKNYIKFTEEYLSKFINDIIYNSDNLELLKLSFILSFNNYYLSLKDELDINRLQSFLNVIYNLCNDIKQYKNFTVQKDESTVDLLKRLDEYFQIFKIGKKLNVLNEPIKYENRNLITEVTEDFFESYKIIIKNSIKPFTYEVYPPLSSGQKAILFIFARIDNAIKKINIKHNNQNIIILLDEADLKLHLEWQRKLINDLITFLNSYNNKIYILYATHSPMILSDITDDRVVFLKKNDTYSEDISDNKKTFGANIYDLYHDSFFMDQFMGQFAQKKINEIIDIINLYKIIEEFEKDQEKNKRNKYTKISSNIRNFVNRYNLYKIVNSYIFRYDNNKKLEQNEWKKFILSKIKKVYKNKKYIHKIKNKVIDKDSLKGLQNTIDLIGEPILRNQLLDEIKNIGVIDTTDEIVNKLKDLDHEEIEKELSKYDREKQIEVWKQLFTKKTVNNG